MAKTYNKKGMRMLFIDIETSPIQAYVWSLFKPMISLNQVIEHTRMLSFAAQWEDEKKVHFYSEYHNTTEEMLDALWVLLDEADVVVHYNGKSFDIKHINREFMENDYYPPSPYKQIDLYQVVKGSFKLASNKLDNVLTRFMGDRKVETGGMGLWIGCLENDPKSWARMKKYNIGDTKKMVPLYRRLLPWITSHPDRTLYRKVKPGELSCRFCDAKDTLKVKAYKPAPGGNVLVYPQYYCQPHKGGCGKYPRGYQAIEREKNGTR